MASIKRLPDGRYQARFRDHAGRQHAKRFDLKGSAQDWLDGQTAALVRGEFVAPRAGDVTFREYAERWRLAQLHHRAQTVAHFESRLRLYAYPHIGDRPLRTIQRVDVQRVVTAASTSLAPSTVEVLYSIMSSVFTSAVVERLIPASPCLRIKLPQLVDSKVTRPSRSNRSRRSMTPSRTTTGHWSTSRRRPGSAPVNYGV